ILNKAIDRLNKVVTQLNIALTLAEDRIQYFEVTDNKSEVYRLIKVSILALDNRISTLQRACDEVRNYADVLDAEFTETEENELKLLERFSSINLFLTENKPAKQEIHPVPQLGQHEVNQQPIPPDDQQAPVQQFVLPPTPQVVPPPTPQVVPPPTPQVAPPSTPQVAPPVPTFQVAFQPPVQQFDQPANAPVPQVEVTQNNFLNNSIPTAHIQV
uniref:ENHANCER OF AG-4 protein 2-like n=1 Tax=Saccoglossus kowalevskii TaxID=10224 RepID=A0ABM0M6B4_SACKO